MRADLRAIVDGLLAASEATGEVTLDAMGEAIGARAVAAEEIDAMIAALELEGRRVSSPEGGGGEGRLMAVVAAARTLGPELGRKPTVAEIAERAGLSTDAVRHALGLLRVMQR